MRIELDMNYEDYNKLINELKELRDSAKETLYNWRPQKANTAVFNIMEKTNELIDFVDELWTNS